MNNNNNINNSMNVMNSNTYLKRMHDLTKDFMNSRKKFIKIIWDNLTFFQKIILIIVIFVLPLIFLLIYLFSKSNINLNRNLNADYSLLDINNNLPFIGIVNNSDENYKNLLSSYLKKNYPDMISNDELNYNINHNKLKNEVDGTYTYSMWMYINGDETGVYNYFRYITDVTGVTDVTGTSNSLPDYNWSNFRYNNFKNIFLRGDSPADVENLNSIKQYPGIWLGPELTNMYLVFSNGSDSESYLLENLELNKWINITVTINNNSVSIYRNGLLEITGLVSGSLYLNNIGNKNIYFLGNPKTTDENSGGFPGFINYFNFYNKVLTPEEINKLYMNYLPLISGYMSKSNYYNLSKAPTVNVITDETSYLETFNMV